MHPVVRDLARTEESLLAIVRRRRDADDPGSEPLRAVLEAAHGNGPGDQAMDLAASLPLASFRDPDLRLLFLGSWANLAIRLYRFDAARAALNQARALARRDTPPEVRAHLLSAEGFLAVTQGDGLARREQLVRQATDALSNGSPRLKAALFELLLILARQGRLAEAEGETALLARQGRGTLPPAAALDLLRFIDAVETGRLSDAAALAPRIDTRGLLFDGRPGILKLYEDERALLESLADLSGTRAESLPPRHQAAVFLARGDIPAALAAARRIHAENPLFHLLAGFESASLIRAELASGHAGAAGRLLAERREKGSAHALDDLFLARAALLDGRPAEAAGLFQKALRAAERSGAGGRLDLELLLAREVPPGDLVRLARAPPRTGDATPGPVPDPTRPAKPLVGESAVLEKVRRTIRKFGPLDASVLVTGETGTGKELVARAIHEAGPRRRHPFLAVNCGAIPETLLESELFGHERGAFTGAERARRGLFEEASSGTLFLDEIGDIPPRLQAALLRVLEEFTIRPVGASRERAVACRVIAATNASLEHRVREGRFREDLLFRLKRLEIRLPPLRERPGDIPILARHFLDAGRPPEVHAALSPALEQALRAHAWPGNVRELKNAMERMRLLNSEKLSYGPEDLALDLPAPAPDAPAPRGAAPAADADRLIAEGRSPLRRLARLRALFERHGTLTRVEIIGILGISPFTATRDLKELLREGVIEKVTPKPAPRTHYFKVRGRA